MLNAIRPLSVNSFDNFEDIVCAARHSEVRIGCWLLANFVLVHNCRSSRKWVVVCSLPCWDTYLQQRASLYR